MTDPDVNAWTEATRFVAETGREVDIRLYPQSVSISSVVTVRSTLAQEALDEWPVGAPGIFANGVDIADAWEGFRELLEWRVVGIPSV